MILAFFRGLFELGLTATAAFIFLSLTLATEVGYRLGHLTTRRRSAKDEEASGISTLTAGMVGLLAFTLSLTIGFAQNRYEARRNLVLTEANAIGTAWLRTKLIDGDEGPQIARKVEDYAKLRLEFTTAPSEGVVPGLNERADVLQNDIWQATQVVARRSPNTVTTGLVNALNEMFDDSASQRFAYDSRVPTELMLALYIGSMVAIGALGYQFGLAGRRQVVLSSLLLLMWSGAMLLIVDLSQPRIGNIRADAAPLVWTIHGFGQN